jgi:hypothetical protein
VNWFRKKTSQADGIAPDAKGLGIVVKFEDGLYGVRMEHEGGTYFLDVKSPAIPNYWYPTNTGDAWVRLGRGVAKHVQWAINASIKERSQLADKGTPV